MALFNVVHTLNSKWQLFQFTWYNSKNDTFQRKQKISKKKKRAATQRITLISYDISRSKRDRIDWLRVILKTMLFYFKYLHVCMYKTIFYKNDFQHLLKRLAANICVYKNGITTDIYVQIVASYRDAGIGQCQTLLEKIQKENKLKVILSWILKLIQSIISLKVYKISSSS